MALVHVELESRASTLAFRPRMFEYYVQLRRDTGLPVLPIALFLRVGLAGLVVATHSGGCGFCSGFGRTRRGGSLK